jgi:type IV fimbrial biogenesis protein FimT
MKKTSLQRGFTLVELIVTLVVASVLLAVAIPGFSSMIKNNRLATSANALVTAANIARSEAIKRGVRVTVCKSADGATCTTSNDWEQGWIVFTDQNNDASVSTGETLIRVHEALPGEVTMQGAGNVANYLSFVGTGQSQLIDGNVQSGTISLCDDRSGAFGRDLAMSATGRISLTTKVTCP